MHKLLRYYNQNRIKIWGIGLAIIFGIILIQTLNSFTKEQNKQENLEKEETTLENVVSYDEQSKSITGGTVKDSYKDQFGEIIDTFFTYCINHENVKAYNMLSNDMKNLKYPNLETFEDGYCKNKFNGNMDYSFQSWSTANKQYVYLVNIYENMLATGKNNKDSYIQDYVTVVSEDDNYKINVDGYIGKKELKKEAQNELVNIQVVSVDQYLQHEIYHFYVKNNTDQTVLLDTKENTKNTYIVDTTGNKYDGLVYENNQEDFIIQPRQTKTISIKFSDTYRSTLRIKGICKK